MREISPTLYKLLLEPHLEESRFSGSAEIHLELTSPQRQITLNAVDLAFWRCRVKSGEGWTLCPFSVHPAGEEVTVELPGESAGQIVLRIDYMGKINEGMAGFYRSRYKAGERTGELAVTQFEESDARRAIPCLDHPARKASFETTLIVPQGLTALSNGPAIEEETLPAGRKRVRFLATPRMSTYLLFFGVGAFEFLEAFEREVLVRVATTPGMTRYGRFGLEFGRKALRYCEDYFGIRYPLPKLDLIAVADFAFGAMENWGAITFRENLILHFPESTSRAGEQRICEVIAHEIAHQWFGNLVTPSDWKYLWLNESFATYFGFGAVDHYCPGWGVWGQFLHTQTERALSRDALHGTFPIEIPGGEHVVINEVTAPIIYSKGASILRQVEGYIGKAGFQEGLRCYLRKHAYGCAASHHLWEALEEVSGRPVTRLMRNWIEQPGHPLLEVCREGETLRVQQKRFTLLPLASDQVWLLPLTGRVFREDGAQTAISALLEGPRLDIPLGDKAQAYKLNAGQTGFYRVLYANAEDLRQLGRLVLEKKLSPEDRWGLLSDRFALFLAGRIGWGDYLGFLGFYRREDAFLPLIGMAESLYHAYLILGETARRGLAETASSALERVLEAIGFEPVREEPPATAALRDEVLFQAALYGSRKAREFGLEAFAALTGGRAVHPDLQRAAIQIAALCAADGAYDWLTRRLQVAESEHERINLLHGLGSFREPALIRESLEFILEKVPERNKFIPICRCGVNPYAAPLLWDWFRARIETLERLHPVHFERVIGGILPTCGAHREEEVKAFFEEYLRRTDRARATIGMALEMLEIHRRARAAVESAPASA